MIPVPCKGGPIRRGFLSWFWVSIGASRSPGFPPVKKKKKRKQCALLYVFVAYSPQIL